MVGYVTRLVDIGCKLGSRPRGFRLRGSGIEVQGFRDELRLARSHETLNPKLYVVRKFDGRWQSQTLGTAPIQ